DRMSTIAKRCPMPRAIPASPSPSRLRGAAGVPLLRLGEVEAVRGLEDLEGRRCVAFGVEIVARSRAGAQAALNHLVAVRLEAADPLLVGHGVAAKGDMVDALAVSLKELFIDVWAGERLNDLPVHRARPSQPQLHRVAGGLAAKCHVLHRL